MDEKNTPAASESYFDGGLMQLLGRKIVAALISAVPLAICVPSAECLIDGTGLQLFGNYIKWFLLTIITIGIYGFWLDIKMRKWVVKHTHFAR